jgi:hypothetical protein
MKVKCCWCDMTTSKGIADSGWTSCVITMNGNRFTGGQSNPLLFQVPMMGGSVDNSTS